MSRAPREIWAYIYSWYSGFYCYICILSGYMISSSPRTFISFKKTVCPDGKYFHQNKLFFIHANYIFWACLPFAKILDNSGKKTKKKIFNSLCTPLEHSDSPSSLYLWAFPQFFKLLKLDNYQSVLFRDYLLSHSLFFRFFDISILSCLYGIMLSICYRCW